MIFSENINFIIIFFIFEDISNEFCLIMVHDAKVFPYKTFVLSEYEFVIYARIRMDSIEFYQNETNLGVLYQPNDYNYSININNDSTLLQYKQSNEVIKMIINSTDFQVINQTLDFDVVFFDVFNELNTRITSLNGKTVYKTRIFGTLVDANNNTEFSFGLKSSVSGLKSITVYYDRYVNALKVEYLNGQEVLFGNSTAASTERTINFVGNTLIAIRIRSGGWIDALQFGFIKNNQQNDVVTWTCQFGGFGGGLDIIDLRLLKVAQTSYEITGLTGFYDNNYVRTLAFTYEQI